MLGSPIALLMPLHYYWIDVCHFQGEVGDMRRDQSMQAFITYIKVICPQPKGNRTLQGFVRKLGDVARENDNKYL